MTTRKAKKARKALRSAYELRFAEYSKLIPPQTRMLALLNDHSLRSFPDNLPATLRERVDELVMSFEGTLASIATADVERAGAGAERVVSALHEVGEHAVTRRCKVRT